MNKITFLNRFFCPQDMIGLYDQISEFFDCESLVFIRMAGFILIYQGL